MKWLVWNGGDAAKDGRPPMTEVLGILETNGDDPLVALKLAIENYYEVDPHPIVERLSNERQS